MPSTKPGIKNRRLKQVIFSASWWSRTWGEEWRRRRSCVCAQSCGMHRAHRPAARALCMIVYSVKAVKRSLRTGTKNPGNIDSISVTVFADISLSLQIQIPSAANPEKIHKIWENTMKFQKILWKIQVNTRKNTSQKNWIPEAKSLCPTMPLRQILLRYF